MFKNPNNTPAAQTQGGYSGKIPTAAIIALEWELTGLAHGMATLTFHVRDGKLARFTTGREQSHKVETGNGTE
jgi:hypothetical protein